MEKNIDLYFTINLWRKMTFNEDKNDILIADDNRIEIWT